MPKRLPIAQLDAVVMIIGQFPEGASLDDITRAMPTAPPRRTLQRWLATLVAEARLTLEGKARATRYHTIPAAHHATVEMLEEAPREYALSTMPLSAEGAEIRAAVRRPHIQRKPVGYRREFLENYRPNETFYLSAETRQQLAKAGTSVGPPLPAGTHARRVLDRLLIDLSWNSSRLEGNTYSLLETERLLQQGESVEGKDAREARMILNHKQAIELLVDQADEIGFNRYTVLNLHAVLADELLDNEHAAGRLRSIPVGVTGTVFHPAQNPAMIEECFDLILASATAIHDPFEQAFFIMVHLPYLQPFEDVNKRTSRLAANIPLIKLNLSPFSFVDMPQRDYLEGILGVYELNRVELLRDVFVWAYRRSCSRYAEVQHTLGYPDPFRLQHRPALDKMLGDVIRGRMDKTAAIAHIRKQAETLTSPENLSRFITLVESELGQLHEGNFARYRLRPKEFQEWRETWR